MTAAIKGSKAATDPYLTSILRDYSGLLARIAASYEANPSLREELLQDIAVTLWRALARWRGDAALKTFVARVAHNRCVDHVVKYQRQPRTTGLDADIVDDSCNPEQHTHRTQQFARLQDAIRGLPLASRQTVTLALEGFSQQEIGETLGITANNVAVRLNRARQMLKTTLGESR